MSRTFGKKKRGELLARTPAWSAYFKEGGTWPSAVKGHDRPLGGKEKDAQMREIKKNVEGGKTKIKNACYRILTWGRVDGHPARYAGG